VAIDHCLAILKAVKIGARCAFVTSVGFFGSNTLAGILDDTASFADRCSRVNANGMDG
jgi:hypothetical protein